MSHAGLILGLPELEVERVDRNDAIAVYANPRSAPAACTVVTRSADQGDLPAHPEAHAPGQSAGHPVPQRHPSTTALRCGRYFRHRFKGVRPRYRASEAFRLEVFETHDGGVTQAKLRRTHGISAATTERWYHGHCQAARLRDVEPTLPQGPGHR
jgi:transposase